MGNWLKKLKENVIRAQLALEIPLARRRGIAARKYWEKIKDQTEEGLRLAGFVREDLNNEFGDYQYVYRLDSRKFVVDINCDGDGGTFKGYDARGKCFCDENLKFRITTKTPPSYIARRLSGLLWPYVEGGL